MDDTLINTFETILPIKFRKALEAMVKEGLKIDHFESGYNLLIEENKTSDTSQEAFIRFLEKLNADKKYLTIAKKIILEPLPFDCKVSVFQGVPQLLSHLKRAKHELALVTIGDETLQKEKMKKTGIQEGFFSKIMFAKSLNKKFCYQSVLEELKGIPEETIVCGDRIHLDLTPARELGMKTIHVLQGRGRYMREPKKDVDYTIETIEELKQLISNLQKKQ